MTQSMWLQLTQPDFIKECDLKQGTTIVKTVSPWRVEILDAGIISCQMFENLYKFPSSLMIVRMTSTPTKRRNLVHCIHTMNESTS